MIPWYWLLFAFVAGGLLGAFVTAVARMGRDDP